MAEAAATALPSNRVNRRLAFVRWVRRTHGWFGLWGALLGLMAGTSGIWLNHRSVMKLELPDQQQTSTQLAMPDPRPATADSMAAWLQGVLKVDRPVTTMRWICPPSSRRHASPSRVWTRNSSCIEPRSPRESR